MANDLSDIVDTLCAAVSRNGPVSKMLLVRAGCEIERLRFAIRRIAEHDATLSVCEGNVAVDTDFALTTAERAAIHRLVEDYEHDNEPASNGAVVTLRGLLARTGGSA